MLWNKEEVAHFLNLSQRSIDRLRQRGLLPWIRVLGRIRFEEHDVKQLLAKLRDERAS